VLLRLLDGQELHADNRLASHATPRMPDSWQPDAHRTNLPSTRQLSERRSSHVTQHPISPWKGDPRERCPVLPPHSECARLLGSIPVNRPGSKERPHGTGELRCVGVRDEENNVVARGADAAHDHVRLATRDGPGRQCYPGRNTSATLHSVALLCSRDLNKKSYGENTC
jgi:hypothetical protein